MSRDDKATPISWGLRTYCACEWRCNRVFGDESVRLQAYLVSRSIEAFACGCLRPITMVCRGSGTRSAVSASGRAFVFAAIVEVC